LRPTPRYLEPSIPPSSVQFNARADVLRYQATRERGRFNPTVIPKALFSARALRSSVT